MNPQGLKNYDDLSYSYDLSVEEVFESAFEFEVLIVGGLDHESFACVLLQVEGDAGVFGEI